MTTIQILSQTRCKVIDLPKKVVGLLDEALAIPIPGAHFQDAVQTGRWDGKRHLFYADRETRSGTFPKGLLGRVETLLVEAGVEFDTDDQRKSHLPVAKLERLSEDMLKGITLRPYQLKAARRALRAGHGILWLATNAGKCLAPDTKVLLATGQRVRADAVHAGNELLGPDSTPRRVLSTTTGRDMMFRVASNRGDNAFVCNSEHVLTLFDPQASAVVDVPLNVFLTWTADRQHRAWLLIPSEGVHFQGMRSMMPVDPWLLGLWYGDGRKDLGFVEITSNDKATVDALQRFATTNGLTLKMQHSADRRPQYRLVTPRGQRNDLLTAIRDVYGDGTRLPKQYMRGTLDIRRAFLAGIIDADGYAYRGTAEVTWKHKRWAKDLVFLARSCGFIVSLRKKSVRLPSWPAPRNYWRVQMTGSTEKLPLCLERKHTAPAKNRTQLGFTVTPVGEGPYAGFTLDGDGRFLLGDFTVTHNTEVAAAMIKVLKEHRVLFLVHKKTLLSQTRERIALRLGTIEEHIGVIGEGKFDPKHITIATIQSLTRKTTPEKAKIIRQYLRTIELLIVDEGHHSKATTWYRLINRIQAQYRYILSGTPFGSGNGLMVEATVGPVVAKVSNKTLVKLGVSAVPTIRFVEINEPVIERGSSWDEVYKEGIVLNTKRNSIIATEAAAFAKAGKPTLILVKELWHGDTLATMLKSLKVSHAFVHGKMPLSIVDKEKARFEDGRTAVLIASPIFDEGVDVPAIRALIIADGGKSVRSVLQKIGRGLRRKEGENALDVLDFADNTHKWLSGHALERMEIYTAEGFELVA